MRSLFFVALILSSVACSTDVFVGPDSGDDAAGSPDAPTHADASIDGGSADGASKDGNAADGATKDAGDGGLTTSVLCNNSTCTNQICCASLSWDTAVMCAAPGNAGSSGCTKYLACDDATDCPQGQVCCSTITTTQITSNLGIAKCASTCPVSTTTIQLCSQNPECLVGSCQDFKGAPSWVKACQ